MMSKLFVLALLAMASVAYVSAETSFEAAVAEVEGRCHPTCRWQCDDPVCPAVCHPVCERPKCQIQCEETECAKCTVHCDKPQCNVRCPKNLCAKENCPKCETVCSPANCHTKCIPPVPSCTPLCEPTKCDWKCKKPNSCPKPKCELVCERSSCPARGQRRHRNARKNCCKCNARNLRRSIRHANRGHSNFVELEQSGALPSFMEVMAEIKFKEASGVEQCCHCDKN